MNKKEFEEIQEQMVKTLLVYEGFCKKANLLKARYNVLFGKYTETEIKLKLENELIVNVVKMLNDKKSLNEVEQIISKGKAIYSKAQVDMAKEFEHDALVVKSFEDEQQIITAEEAFKEYVTRNHPAIKMSVSNNEAQLYNALRSLYCENNASGFNSVLEMNKNLLSQVEFTEDKYTEYYKYYMNTARQIQLDMQKRLEAFPFIKEAVFTDDMSIAAEQADIRVRINALTGVNKALHVDLISVYGEDINL